jgi:hypothetical protein
MKIGLHITLMVLLLTTSSMVRAQLNFLVGYNLGIHQDHQANSLLEAHIADNPWFKTEFRSLDIQHGLHLGLRYGFTNARMGLTYRNTGIRAEAEGIPPNEEMAFRRQVFLRTNSLGLSLESANKLINPGVSLEYNLLRISGRTSQFSENYRIQENGFFSATAYINFEFGSSGNIGFIIQPYWSYGLTTFGLNELAEDLAVAPGDPFRRSMFGCAFLMSNGPR